MLSAEYSYFLFKHLLWKAQGARSTEHLFSQMILLLSTVQLTLERGSGLDHHLSIFLLSHALVHSQKKKKKAHTGDMLL